MTEEHKLPSDAIRLCNGELWTVPPLPGGTSEEAMKCVSLAMKCVEEARRLSAREKRHAIYEKSAHEAIEDLEQREERLEEIADMRAKANSDWMKHVCSVGFDFLVSLFNYGRSDEEAIGPDEAAKLFMWPQLGSQLFRARTIALLGKFPEVKAKADEKEGAGEAPDFPQAESPTSETANGGSSPKESAQDTQSPQQEEKSTE
jgi:hypothetical protein